MKYIYIMVFRPYGAIYVGCTVNLIRRVYAHKESSLDGLYSTT